MHASDWIWIGLVVAAIAGLVDVDAITLTVGRMAANGLDPAVAATAVLLAAGVNTLSKTVMGSAIGGRRFGVMFMGGSLIPHGGQNPIEAVKLGAAIMHGPHVSNFAEIYSGLDAAGGAEEVGEGRPYDDLAALLEREHVDVLHVCTPNAAHAAQALAAIERGIHVVCEKPLAVSTEESRAMLAAVRSGAPSHAVESREINELGRIQTSGG